ncbi:MAG: response regulator, partial [Nitrospinota bacterium]|nr:response regulator [Nitrospinota bacterium]
ARLDPGLPQKVMGDPVRLNQVLANLIGNSIKFTSRGEVVVTVEPHGQGPGVVTQILFKVTDTGIGITPEQQERIFSRFTQGDPSITRKYGGAGLGVTISRQLVEMMGGKIWMESKPGEGSIFQFKIPMKAVASPAQAPEEYHMFDGKTVVIVDDNDSARGELARMAKELGLAVTERADGASALAVIMESGSAGRQFNMAVIDQDMPRMSGTELARKIKLAGWSGGTRVILLSPVKEDLDETAMPEGVDALLSKPVKEEDFANAVKAVLLSHAPIDKSRPAENERVDKGVKILLAEDNPINQEVAIAMLTRMGHTVDVAENGALAVDMWSTGKYDLVLMDIQMPVMDGFSATATIRSRERDSQTVRTPIIAMTAHAMEGDRQKCLNAGMDDYLAKPIIYTKLAERVKAASGGGPQEPPAAPARAEQSAFTVHDVSARLGLDRDSAARLVEKFIETSEKNIISLAEAITHRNVELAYRMAHSIKGSSMQLGAYTMGALAEQLETLGRAGVLSETAQEKLAALEEAFEKVKKDLKG